MDTDHLSSLQRWNGYPHSQPFTGSSRSCSCWRCLTSKRLWRISSHRLNLCLVCLSQSIYRIFRASQSTPVQRWSARWLLHDGCLRRAWKALLEKQAIQKAQEESQLKAELEESQALRDYDWINRSRFIGVDDSAAATTFRGQSLKVIVKVSWISGLDAVGPRPCLMSCRRLPATFSSLDRNMRGHGISKEW